MTGCKHAPDCGISDLCDALRWIATEGTVQAITTITGAWTPRGLLQTANITGATGTSDVRIVEHVPLALAQGGPLVDYISRDPNAITTSLVTRWNPNHAPISPLRLRQAMLRTMYTAREKAPFPEADVAPEMQNQKVTYKVQKPISQFLAAHLRPTWDRLRVREVVAAFWGLPNDVHAAL